MEIGVYDFGEIFPDPASGHIITAEERLRNLVEQAQLADQVGLDVFGLGEHHRSDFQISSPAVVLASMAERTERLRLTSAVTILSSDDPVRVFQDFATLDLLSGGRAEIMAGRGSFIESFPLFGYGLEDYDELFHEKIQLLLKIRDREFITWDGKHRPPLVQQGIYPRPKQDRLPIWIAVGGNPGSAVRAGVLGTPMAVAIIGGQPERFVQLVDLYRASGERTGHDASTLAVSINSHAFLADTSQEAADTFYPHYAEVMTKLGEERGWPPMTRLQFDAGLALRGHLLVGSPQQVIEKILYQCELFGHDRFLAQMSVGAIPHKPMMRAVELLGSQVAPQIRKAIESRKSHATEAGQETLPGIVRPDGDHASND
ncbi:MAG TPA: LLM class flavin-dependent oxidoreductase [Acidimicrobiia bacterium]|nr:LLM class flavin-dependent oxidoreductase [Acidimicrobiia bacterium]